MPFLTINGTTIPVQSSNALREEDHRQGSIRYSHAGTLLCSLRNPKKSWRFLTRPLVAAEETTIRGATEAIVERSVSGTGIPGTIPALVLLGDQPYIQDGLSHQQILEIRIYEL